MEFSTDFERLTLHSKVAIATSVCLIFVGTVLFFAFEFKNSSTIGDYSLGEKLLTSLFQSVSSRTAGFVTVTQDSFRMHTYLIIMLLILIGGSPMSTSGGLKTTTVAIVMAISGKNSHKDDTRQLAHKRIIVG